MKTQFTAVAFALVSIVGVQAQTPTHVASAPVPPAQAVMDLVVGFESQAMEAARAMPAEKYGFTPASLHIPGANYTGDVHVWR